MQRWNEITLTVGYALLKNFELRAETRHDFSNVSSFINKNGVSTSNNQQSYAIEAVAKFLRYKLRLVENTDTYLCGAKMGSSWGRVEQVTKGLYFTAL